MKKILLGILFIGISQLFAVEFNKSNLNNFIDNMEKYNNQDIEVVFNAQENVSLTTSINNGYYAIENISDYTRYVELNNIFLDIIKNKIN